MTDAFQTQLEPFLRAMTTRLLAATARSLRSADLSLAQVASLYLLGQAGTLRVGQLGDMLDMGLPAASRMATDMVDRGLFIRREDPSDRRAKSLSLSAKGHALLGALSKQTLGEVSLVLGQLDPGQRATFEAELAQVRGDDEPDQAPA